MSKIHRNSMAKSTRTVVMHGTVFVTVTILLFSMPSMLTQQPYFAHAGTCVGYDQTKNTITITCDASFRDIVQAVNDPSVLQELTDGGSGEYLLSTNLQVGDGATLSMGPNDIKWLKIAGGNGITINGKIQIDGVKITSWDTENNSPVIENDVGTVPRAFINLLVSEGGFIRNSEIAYLGYDELPRRGIDLGTAASEPSHDFAIRNSKVHDNWMGFFSAGAYNILIDGSEFYGNIKYGIDPHTGTHNMTVSNNKIYNNGGIGAICSDQCYDIIFEGNEVHDNSVAGLMFSRATHDSIMRNNLIYSQQGAAVPISISESQNNKIYGNNISNSTEGVYIHNQSSGNMVYDNTFNNVENAIRTKASTGNTLSNNHFHNVGENHYVMSSNAALDIQKQVFSSTNIRGGSGANTLSIGSSGTIIVDNNMRHNTDEQPYTQVLSSEDVSIDSASG